MKWQQVSKLDKLTFLTSLQKFSKYSWFYFLNDWIFSMLSTFEQYKKSFNPVFNSFIKIFISIGWIIILSWKLQNNSEPEKLIQVPCSFYQCLGNIFSIYSLKKGRPSFKKIFFSWTNLADECMNISIILCLSSPIQKPLTVFWIKAHFSFYGKFPFDEETPKLRICTLAKTEK